MITKNQFNSGTSFVPSKSNNPAEFIFKDGFIFLFGKPYARVLSVFEFGFIVELVIFGEKKLHIVKFENLRICN